MPASLKNTPVCKSLPVILNGLFLPKIKKTIDIIFCIGIIINIR